MNFVSSILTLWANNVFLLLVLILSGCVGNASDSLPNYEYVVELDSDATIRPMHLGILVEAHLYQKFNVDANVTSLGVSDGATRWIFVSALPDLDALDPLAIIEEVILQYARPESIRVVRPVTPVEQTEIAHRQTESTRTTSESQYVEPSGSPGMPVWIWVDDISYREAEFLLAHLAMITSHGFSVTAIFNSVEHSTYLELRLPEGVELSPTSSGNWLFMNTTAEIKYLIGLLEREGIRVKGVNCSKRVVFADRKERVGPK